MRSRNNPLAILISLAGLALAASPAQAVECGFLAPWTSVRDSKPAQFEKIADYNAWMSRYRAALESGAREFYAQYRVERVSGAAADSCFGAEVEKQEFNRLLPRVFLEESTRELKTVGPIAARFAATVERKSRAGELSAFRLVGHHEDYVNPTGELAGYHRANHSIFMDIATIPGKQWLVVFAHELAHAVDADLAASLAVYNDPKAVAEVAQWAHQSDDPSTLSPEQQAKLDRWLLAGLQRGLLTETRAWTLTLQVYKDGAGNAIPWMERNFTSETRANPTLASVLAELSPRFTDPTDGIFSLPLLQKRLAQIRASLLTQVVPLNAIPLE